MRIKVGRRLAGSARGKLGAIILPISFAIGLSGCFPETGDSQSKSSGQLAVSSFSDSAAALFESIFSNLSSGNSSGPVVNRTKKTARLDVADQAGSPSAKSPVSSDDKKSNRIVANISAGTLHQSKLSAASPDQPLLLDEVSLSQARKQSLPKTKSLANFYRALAGIETGTRSRPVTVLHIGDDQISMDRFAGNLRKMFQERFGDAGRGMLAPGLAYPLYRARGVRITEQGVWRTASSVTGDKGHFGFAGVVKHTLTQGSSLNLESLEQPFTWAEAVFLTGPDRGEVSLEISGNDRANKRVSLRTPTKQLKRVRLVARGTKLTVRSLSDRPVSISSWSIGEERPGVRYVSLGMPKARAELIHNRWDLSLLKYELDLLKPDLIVLNYGLNESRDDKLNVQKYSQALIKTVSTLSTLTPESSVIVIGMRDLNRIPKHASQGSELADRACRALSNDEQANYGALKARKDQRLNRWHAPPNLQYVRSAQLLAAAKSGAYFWDWSKLMQGNCGIHQWVHNAPAMALPDHVRLTENGIQYSARALFTDIVSGYTNFLKLAQNSATAQAK
ncbi:MAG: hypothetical protein ACR2OW_06680 [Methyloligellaceae bacterium]